jgi:hypothetical protein
MTDKNQDPLWSVVKVIATDYSNYGGSVERWQDPNQAYPDCSSGCRWWRSLYDERLRGADSDWGVCTNPDSLRSGLLTFEHQAGADCFECEPESCGDWEYHC